MFVVRIETDEALLFRVFRRGVVARIWAARRIRNAESQTDMVDVFDIPGVDDDIRAIEAVRDGAANLVSPGLRPAVDAPFLHAYLFAGVGAGTGF